MGVHFFRKWKAAVLLDLQSTREIIGQFRAALLPTMPRAGQARVTTCTPFILRVFLSAIPPSPERFVLSFVRYVVSRAFLSMTYIYLPRGRGTPNPTQPSIRASSNVERRPRPTVRGSPVAKRCFSSDDVLWPSSLPPSVGIFVGPSFANIPSGRERGREEESRVNFVVLVVVALSYFPSFLCRSLVNFDRLDLLCSSIVPPSTP